MKTLVALLLTLTMTNTFAGGVYIHYDTLVNSKDWRYEKIEYITSSTTFLTAGVVAMSNPIVGLMFLADGAVEFDFNSCELQNNLENLQIDLEEGNELTEVQTAIYKIGIENDLIDSKGYPLHEQDLGTCE